MSTKGLKAVDEAVKLWMDHPDVTGVSLSEEDGDEIILVLVEILTDDVKSFIPPDFMGFKVKTMEVGAIVAEDEA